MALSNKHFWAHVLQTTAEGISFFFGFLGQPKVSYLQMPFDVHHYIFRFQIPVDDILRVEVLYCKEYFDEILPGRFLIESDDFSLKVKKLSSGTVVQDHDVVELSRDELFHMH